LFKVRLAFVLSAPLLLLAPVCMAAISINMKVPTFIQVEGGTVNFLLPFSDFTTGAESETAVVLYTVIANSVNRSQGVLKAKINSTDTDLNVQAKFNSFTNQGGNAALVQSQPGFVILTTTDISLADKVRLSGSGRIVQGDVGIAFKAKALTELAAQTRIKTVQLTFTDA